MKRFWTAVVLFVIVTATSAAQQPSSPPPAKPQLEGTAWIQNLDQYNGKAVELSGLARHLGTQYMFSIGKNEGREIPVLIPNPSVDTANVGDFVTITGTVRYFEATAFARDYPWFKPADYTGLSHNQLVIVAASVRGAAGGQLPAVGAPGREK